MCNEDISVIYQQSIEALYKLQETKNQFEIDNWTATAAMCKSIINGRNDG